MEFAPFPKLSRLFRDMVVTEKIDGTNACVVVVDGTSDRDAPGRTPIAKVGDLWLYAQSRKRFITPEQDNFGFAKWVADNAIELAELGQGRHYGEWWGQGIQRGYGLDEKRFSLFNVGKWGEERPECCHVVPVLRRWTFDHSVVNSALDDLRENGSVAAPGFANPEGVIVYHTAANIMFKATLEKDELPKSLAVAA